MWILALLILGVWNSVQAASTESNDCAGQWERWEQAFTAEEQADGQRLELLVELTAPSGEEHTVRGFWDGGDTWRVRFMPVEEGQWTYRTSSEPAVEGLDDESGEFECGSSMSGTPFLQHGAVRVAENGTHLEHADGTPFFWLVDTAWNGPLLSSPGDWDAFLQNRAEKQFTGIKFVMTQWRTAASNAEEEVAYTGFEDIEINPDFFKRMDERIDAVNEQGLLAVPVLLWTLGSAEENPGQLPESEAIRLARYMVARYQANHVMYFLPGDGNYLDENAERWKRIGEAVYDLDGHAPAMLHPQGMQWPYPEWREAEWVNVNAYQSGHGDDDATLRWIHSGPPAENWGEAPIRPAINVEPPYEDHIAYQSGERHTAYTVRRAMYWSLLNAPTAGVSYGAHGVWSWQEEPGEPRNHEGSGEAKPWREAMELPGSQHARHLVELFTSMDWWRLRPDERLVDSPPASAVRIELSHVLYTRDEEGNVALYVDGELQAEEMLRGDLSNWDESYRLALGDELVGERNWEGEYRGVAIYDRALEAEEAARQFEAGPTESPAGALVYYGFEEGGGGVVRDRSREGDPLDLMIEESDAVEWVDGGLRVHAQARIASERPAEKVVDAIKETGAVTVEAWIAPENVVQSGPARIVTLSEDHGQRNLTLGQDAGMYEVRLRTTETSPNGEPATRTANGAEGHISASRTEAGDAAVVYLPLGGTVRVNADVIAGGVEAQWFNPRDGSTQPAEREGEGTYRAPSDGQDWVLRFHQP